MADYPNIPFGKLTFNEQPVDEMKSEQKDEFYEYFCLVLENFIGVDDGEWQEINEKCSSFKIILQKESPSVNQSEYKYNDKPRYVFLVFIFKIFNSYAAYIGDNFKLHLFICKTIDELVPILRFHSEIAFGAGGSFDGIKDLYDEKISEEYETFINKYDFFKNIKGKIQPDISFADINYAKFGYPEANPIAQDVKIKWEKVCSIEKELEDLKLNIGKTEINHSESKGNEIKINELSRKYDECLKIWAPEEIKIREIWDKIIETTFVEKLKRKYEIINDLCKETVLFIEISHLLKDQLDEILNAVISIVDIDTFNIQQKNQTIEILRNGLNQTIEISLSDRILSESLKIKLNNLLKEFVNRMLGHIAERIFTIPENSEPPSE